MKYIALIPFVFAFAAGSAMAQDAGEQSGLPGFDEIDANGNGVVDIEEAENALPDDLIIVDTNNDGILNLSEAELAIPQLSYDSEEGEQAEQEMDVDQEAYEQFVEVLQEQQSDSS